MPALITDRGTLTETPAILQFIAQSHPAAGLAPLNDVFALARMNAFNSYLCSTVHVAHAHRMRGYRWSDDLVAIVAMQKKVPQLVGECFELIETEFFAGPWVMGERYGVSDMYLFTLAQWLQADGVDPARFPKVSAHRARMRTDPVVRRVIDSESAHGDTPARPTRGTGRAGRGPSRGETEREPAPACRRVPVEPPGHASPAAE